MEMKFYVVFAQLLKTLCITSSRNNIGLSVAQKPCFANPTKHDPASILLHAISTRLKFLGVSMK